MPGDRWGQPLWLPGEGPRAGTTSADEPPLRQPQPHAGGAVGLAGWHGGGEAPGARPEKPGLQAQPGLQDALRRAEGPGGLQRQWPDQIASSVFQEPPPARAGAPGLASRIVAGPLTVTAPSATGSCPSPQGLSGPPSQRASLRPDSWPGQSRWTEAGRAPAERHGRCSWCVLVLCPLGLQWLLRNQASRG